MTLQCNSSGPNNIDGLLLLQSIYVNGGNANNICIFNNLPSLQYFRYTVSSVTSITITNASSLIEVRLNDNNALTSLSIDSAPSLKKLWANNCNISNYNVSNASILEDLDLSTNNLTAIAINSYPLLKTLELSYNHIVSTSSFSNLNNLQTLNLKGNSISNLILPPLPSIVDLRFDGNNSNNLVFANYPNLEYLDIAAGNLATIDLSSNANLWSCIIYDGNLSTLNLSNNPLISQLVVSGNPIAAFDLSNNNMIESLHIYDCPITALDFSDFPLLSYVTFSGNLFNDLDFSHNPQISSVVFNNNPNLTHINLKSGIANTIYYTSSNVPNLSFICTDEDDVLIIGNSSPIVPTSSYCSFTPGGEYNIITGTAIYDSNNNGCESTDPLFNNVRININNGTTNGATFSNLNGTYVFYVQQPTLTLSPSIENPSYFNISPTTVTITFPSNNNLSQTQDFCINANGVHNDLEVVLVPILGARPGFDATYKLIFKNKGNQTLSGAINLTFDDAKTDFISSTPTTDSQAFNSLAWNYSNLLPFETRAINLTLNINAPTETPAVNSGDILHFTAAISPTTGDELPLDNVFNLNQTVVNSLDPNDKTCLEGNTISPSEIGNYVHYNINFENIGTENATNIVVKDIIDTTKFDITSLQLMYASHPVDTKITGNKVEFVFQGINLPPSSLNPIGGHGNVLFKIKTLNSLVVGDQVANTAHIYFDYNAPVATNEARTTYTTLNTGGFTQDTTVLIYPNPTQNTITVNAKTNLKSIQVFDIQGRILETIIESKNSTTIDLTAKSNGVYFLKITTEQGSKIEKIIKE